MLHIAPEPAIEQRLRECPGLDYLTADLADTRAMIEMDITDIQFADDTFDFIYCNHVLEHIPDDRLAIRELRRVLRPDGMAVIMVPVLPGATVEDPTLSDPEERARRFGQPDHFRIYGSDFTERLTECGFAVQLVHAEDFMDPSERTPLGLATDDVIFVCRDATLALSRHD